MSDRYAQLLNAPAVGPLAGAIGLPRPVRLARHTPGGPVCDGAAVVGQAPRGTLSAAVDRVLDDAGITAGVLDGASPLQALIFDASGIEDSRQLVELRDFFYPLLGRLAESGRVLVLGRPPASCPHARAATAQRALEGFTRSLGKEVGRGATVQELLVAPGAEEQLAGPLRFFLSPRSAYVSGQVVELGPGRAAPEDFDFDAPQRGRTVLVTGASRGIGLAICQALREQGASVVGLDIPTMADELQAAMEGIGAASFCLDITAGDAPDQIAQRFAAGLDVVVHNAGITADRTLAKMPPERWSNLMEINLSAAEDINDALLDEGILAVGGRIVCVSSMSGIAGNAGQTNYATSKAGVIGMVRALAPRLGRPEHDATINAVAPGFIETKMTAAMPIGVREAGRRLNSLRQGGLPVDVAETVAWLASPASGAVNGQTVRVCGQSLLGA